MQEKLEPLTSHTASNLDQRPKQLITEGSIAYVDYGNTIINDESELMLKDKDESLYSLPT